MDRLKVRLLSQYLEGEKDYWLRKLEGELVVSGLPADFDPSQDAEERKEIIAVTIEPDVSSKLLLVSDHNESLIFTLLVTALSVCLYKYTGINDVIVGTTIHETHKEDSI